ncbi:hypothetical protein E4U23_000767, partial [Claviceps purpurea]
MVRGTSLLLLSAALVSGTTARDVPANVKALYEWIRYQGKCRYVLAGGFHSLEEQNYSPSKFLQQKFWKSGALPHLASALDSHTPTPPHTPMPAHSPCT